MNSHLGLEFNVSANSEIPIQNLALLVNRYSPGNLASKNQLLDCVHLMPEQVCWWLFLFPITHGVMIFILKNKELKSNFKKSISSSEWFCILQD